MKSPLRPLEFPAWLRMSAMLAVAGALTPAALWATNPPTTPPGKNYGDQAAASDEESDPDQGDGKDCDGTDSPSDPNCNTSDGSSGGDDPCPCDKPSCIREYVPLAVAPNEPGLGSGMIQLYIEGSGPNLGSREHLDYFGIPQMSITEKESAGSLTNYGIVQAGGSVVKFGLASAFQSGESSLVGKPVGATAYSQARTTYVNASGAFTDQNGAAYVRHYRGASGFVDYPAAGGKAVRYTTREGRVYSFPLAQMEIIRERSNGTLVVNGPYADGVIRQVKTVAGLLDVVKLTDRSYEIRKYAPRLIGGKVNGVFTVTGAPHFVMKVMAPAGTQNALTIIKTEGSQQVVTQHTCAIESGSESWTQQVATGAFAFERTLTRGPLANMGPDYRRSTWSATMKAAPGGGSYAGNTPDYKLEADTYKYAPLESRQNFSSGAATTRSRSFASPSWDANGVGRPTSQTTRSGGSLSYAYDSGTGKMASRTTAVSRPGTGGGGAIQTETKEYSYSSVAAGDSATMGDFRPRTTVSKRDGVTTGKSFFASSTSGGSYIETRERTTNPTANYGDAGNLREQKEWYGGTGTSRGRLKQVRRENGTLVRYEYADKPSNSLEVTTYDLLDPQGNPVSARSTRTRELREVRGWPVEITRAEWVNGTWLDYEKIVQTYNDAGRLTKRERVDLLSSQQRVLLQQEWNGRLLTRTVDEEGVSTRYEYFTGTKVLHKIRREAVAASGSYPAQPEIVTTYSGTFTLNEKQDPEWKQRTTTTSAGSLTLVETETFDEKGRVVSHTDANGYVTATSYSVNGQTVTQTLPSGATRVTVKDSKGRTLSVAGTGVVAKYYHYQTDASGNTKTTVYTAQDNGPRYVTTTTDPAGRTVSINRPAFTGQGTATTSFTYSSSLPDLPVAISRTGEAHRIVEYDTVGKIVRTGQSADDTALTANSDTDRIALKAYSLEHAAGQLWRVTTTSVNPTAGSGAEKVVATTKDLIGGLSGTVVSKTVALDVANNETVTTVSLSGSVREVAVQRPGVTGQEIGTSHAGRLVALSRPGIAGLELIGYDVLGRETSRKDPRHTQASVTTYVTGSNLVASTADAAGNTTSYTYHPQGQPGAGEIRTVTLPDTTVTYRAYTLRGELMAEWGSQTNPTWREYAATGELWKLHTWQTAPTLNVDAMPSAVPSGSAVTTWTYDNGSALLASKTYADGKDTAYGYDAAGRMTERKWARLHAGNRLTTSYGWDGFGGLASVNYADSTPDVAVTRDRLGRITSQGNGLATSAFAYSTATLRLSGETITYDLDGDDTPELVRELSRTEDAYLRPTGYQLKDGTTVEADAVYGRDSAGRIDSASSTELGSFDYSFATGSSLVETLTGPVHTVTNAWEPDRDVLDTKTNVLPGSTPATVSAFDYAVNAIGQRTGVSQSGDAFASARTVAWGYDALGQVTSADSSVADHDRAYEFDAIGNRKKSADGLTLPATDNYDANEVNQYASIGALAPGYDADGNATAYPLPAAPTANSALAWDAENRLKSTTVAGSATTYLYDSWSRRIARTMGTVTTLYLYDGWNYAAEYTWSGSSAPAVSETYLWGKDLSGSLQGAGGVGGLLALGVHSQGSPTQAYFPTYDGNGNVSEYLVPTGATSGPAAIVAAHFEYDAFGRTVVDTDTAGAFDMRFSTKKRDAATGLYYYGYRYYDPVTGRWLSRDPIADWSLIRSECVLPNVYEFLRNAATNDFEVLGLFGWGDVPIIGGLIDFLFKSKDLQDKVDERQKKKQKMLDELSDPDSNCYEEAYEETEEATEEMNEAMGEAGAAGAKVGGTSTSGQPASVPTNKVEAAGAAADYLMREFGSD